MSLVGKLARTPRLVAALTVVAVPCPSAWAAPVINTNFTGITLNATIALGTGAAPPETIGAVGSSHIVEFVR